MSILPRFFLTGLTFLASRFLSSKGGTGKQIAIIRGFHIDSCTGFRQRGTDGIFSQ